MFQGLLGTWFVHQAALELKIIPVFMPPECWDYRYVPYLHELYVFKFKILEVSEEAQEIMGI